MSLFSELKKLFSPRSERKEKEERDFREWGKSKERQFQRSQQNYQQDQRRRSDQILANAENQSHLIIQSANTKAREIIVEAKDAAYKIKQETDREIQKIREESLAIEKRISVKEENLDKKMAEIETKEGVLKEKAEALDEKIAEVEKTKTDLLDRLEKIAGLTKEEAKNLLLTGLSMKLVEQKAKVIRESETAAKEEAERKAKEILVNSMVKGATDYVAEYTISVVKLQDEEIKGRIIGKEGRNIRSLELATGVEFDIDNTPGEIRLSCFDPVRREIARISLEKLIADGRIQPAKIEEIVDRTKKDIEKIIFEEGTKLCHAVGVYNLQTEIVKLLGRFKYRFSYGQNMIAHTLEETRIGLALAHEIKADANIVRLGCLLHDIGKVITEEEGSHVELGVKLLRKYQIPEEVVACVAEHHEDRPFSSAESMLVYISDAISGARPGARYEDLGAYLKRLEDLEAIGKSFKGVHDCYAFQAGREVRVILDPEKINDDQATVIAHEMKMKIEETVKNFPGQIKITVIREKRFIQTAK